MILEREERMGGWGETERERETGREMETIVREKH